MDRIGTFAVAASLVVLSALHMLNAPNYAIALPAILFVGGVARMLVARPDGDAVIDPRFSRSTEA